MLLRAYRLTDKVSVIILKTLVVLSELMADGLLLVLGSAVAGRRRGLLGIVGWLLAGVGKVLAFVAGVLLAVLGAVGAVLRRFTSSTVTVAGRVSRSTRSGVDSAMARRSARAEMATTIVEDPLRVQNRLLGGVVIVMLVALIGVVIWATGERSPAPLVVAGNVNLAGLSLNPADEAPDGQGVSAPPLVATPIPTATLLPEVLQVRGSIAFTVRENGQTDLWAVPVGSRTPIRITNDPADERDPAWSPDQLRLAYASNKDGNWEIYIYNLITGQTERKTFSLSYEGRPSWSPDGNWLVYETYQGGQLDIYVLPVTDQNAPLQPITNHPAPDFSPAWSPNGREIAFVSLRDGTQDIFVVSLDDISSPVNLTRTATRAEDHPAWSPDGRLIAYSALDEGIEKVFVKPADNPSAPAQLIGRGRTPSWSPDGRSIIAAVDSLDSTHLTVYPYEDNIGMAQIIAVPPRASQPVWTELPLPAALVSSGGLPLNAPRLYVEQETPFANGLYPLGPLINSVDAPNPQLSDRVNDSFNALRERVLSRSGRDYLARLSDAFWDLNQRPQPGEATLNWHYTGRAFAIDRNSALVGFPPVIEIVREDRDLNTYWRVYLRVDDNAQSGQLGEPLRRIPWDINSRFEGDVAAYEAGGRLRSTVPQGYYIDLTEIAEDYGWLPLPAGSDWRLNFNAMNYWAFHKPSGLTWVEAMLEIWTRDQVNAFAPGVIQSNPSSQPLPPPQPEEPGA